MHNNGCPEQKVLLVKGFYFPSLGLPLQSAMLHLECKMFRIDQPKGAEPIATIYRDGGCCDGVYSKDSGRRSNPSLMFGDPTKV